MASGQIVNANKSTIYSGSISHARLLHIAAFLGFNIGSLPFVYLGVPIFKVSLLKELKKWIKNFIWSGDIFQRKLVTVSWKKLCRPYSEGGLGLRSLMNLNEASKLKLCWDLLNSQEQWAVLIKSRVFRGHRCITRHIFSSIWSSVHSHFSTVWDNSVFIVGDGKEINFWTDRWCGYTTFAQLFDFPDHFHHRLQAKVSDFIVNSQWGWSPQCKIAISAALVNILSIIWFVRNQSRDFTILKRFSINVHLPKAPSIIEVIWHPPYINWVKCNTDGAATNDKSACGGIFRNQMVEFLGGFAENTGNNNAFFAELSGALRAIELAHQNQWLNLWLETDSILVESEFELGTLHSFTFKLVLVATHAHADLPCELYWNFKLPTTQMPKAITDLLHPAGNGKVNDDIGADPIDDLHALYNKYTYEDLHHGTKMNMKFKKNSNYGKTFMSQEVANSIPFSSNNVENILNMFSIKQGSKESEIVKNTISMCEEHGIKGEEKTCVTSLKSMVDFAISKLGNNVEAVSTEVNKESNGTKVYIVPLEGVDGNIVKVVAVCHNDTSQWNPKHISFQILKVQPGTDPICHFVTQEHVVWVSK
ncbi:hypothetical protein TSUD_10120 [Trifolium subterraneum]|nr:hypothetical protein TSUD_10120 [Trifolium subterraneum]